MVERDRVKIRKRYR